MSKTIADLTPEDYKKALADADKDQKETLLKAEVKDWMEKLGFTHHEDSSKDGYFVNFSIGKYPFNKVAMSFAGARFFYIVQRKAILANKAHTLKYAQKRTSFIDDLIEISEQQLKELEELCKDQHH